MNASALVPTPQCKYLKEEIYEHHRTFSGPAVQIVEQA
jgi:hypothetical protein